MLIVEHFERGALLHGSRAVVIEGNTSITYGEMALLMRRIAGALLGQGLSTGSAVGILSPNHHMVLACQYGILKAGLVWVPINYRNAAQDNVRQLARYDTKWLFFHSSLASHAKAFVEDYAGTVNAVSIDAPVAGFPFLADWIAPYDGTHPAPIRTMADPIAIMSTGGTTGDPKGAVHNSRSFEAVISSVYALFPMSEPPVHLIIAPLTHAAAIFHYALLPRGGTNVLLGSTDPADILEAIETHRVSIVYLPPTLIYRVLAHPQLHDYDCSSLRYLLYGAAPMSTEKLREAIDFFGPVMIQSYGQTECLMWTTALTPADHKEILANPAIAQRIKSVGRAGPFCQTEILRDDGSVAAAGEHGEVAFRSDLQMDHFFGQPEATAEIRRDGWQRSGDIGYKDEDGFVYIVDRKRDMIISGGFNVFPSEIEQVVLAYPAVQDCAVIGAPDDKWGEMVVAAIELKPNSGFDESDLIAFCKQQLGSIKAPKRIDIWPELPRSTVGKTLRRKVRETYWEGHNKRV